MFIEESRTGERGQAALILVLLFACLVLGGMGFAVDFSNLWFHRQAAQAAADAACQAGALDLLEKSGGQALPSMGFLPGVSGDCATYPGASMCAYARFNGYSGAGPRPSSNLDSEWNTVTWSFPASVPGVAAPPVSMSTSPYLQVRVAENVPTYFLPFFTASHYWKVGATCTCGLAQVKQAAPVLVLNPSAAATLRYTGVASLSILGGPERSIQVNSTNAQAVSCSGSALIDTSQGGPQGTGSDVGVTGPQAQAENGCGNKGGFNGGQDGAWRSGVLQVADPYASIGPPTSVRTVTPITGTSGTWVRYQQDGCPDSRTDHFPTSHQCIEFGPGYYPNGIKNLDGYSTAIFLPGVYYMNGPLQAGGSELLRNATPCLPACSSISAAAGLVGRRSDGVMFYFLSGSFQVSGCSGCAASGVDDVNATAFSCDGSPPDPRLNMPATLGGNVLWAQCASGGAYWDPGGDTADSAGNPGARGILFFQDHGNTAQPKFAGSGSLSYVGSLYFHSNGYNDQVNLVGASSGGSYIVGNIVADTISISGNGEIHLALTPLRSLPMLKAAVFR